LTKRILCFGKGRVLCIDMRGPLYRQRGFLCIDKGVAVQAGQALLVTRRFVCRDHNLQNRQDAQMAQSYAFLQACVLKEVKVCFTQSHAPSGIYSTAQHSTAQHSTAQHSTAQHSTAQHRAQHSSYNTKHRGNVDN